MKFTSIGYHTFNLFHKLTVEEGETVLNDAYKYRDQTGAIRVRPLTWNDYDSNSSDFTEKLAYKSRYFLIEYINGHKGLSWLLRLSPKSPGFISYLNQDTDRPCSIKARINPKPFIGIREYLAAANVDYLDKVEVLFNHEAAKISPILGCFEDYEFNRIDYCINFALHELGIDCDPLLIMELFRRSNVPKHFYCPRKSLNSKASPMDGTTAGIASSAADESDRDKFILTSDSININCYYKYNQLRETFPDCPNIRDSVDVIRFEVQSLYPKTYYMSKAFKNRDGFTNLFSEMLSDDTSAGIIVNYFNKIIGRGDYYSLEEAIKKIQSHHFAPKKENRLIAVLEEANIRGGIANTKIALVKPEVRETFRRSVRELAVIGINPVTIPKEYVIKHIPNLLDTYYDKVQEVDTNMEIDEWKSQIYKNYVRENGSPFIIKKK